MSGRTRVFADSRIELGALRFPNYNESNSKLFETNCWGLGALRSDLGNYGCIYYLGVAKSWGGEMSWVDIECLQVELFQNGLDNLNPHPLPVKPTTPIQHTHLALIGWRKRRGKRAMWHHRKWRVVYCWLSLLLGETQWANDFSIPEAKKTKELLSVLPKRNPSPSHYRDELVDDWQWFIGHGLQQIWLCAVVGRHHQHRSMKKKRNIEQPCSWFSMSCMRCLH